ncbi:hypothetical protein BV898_15034 [Hypsibius exemplaris]|uniref:Coiled-coil domain-containing protein 86 n=1 Tax=Hypsibius exemplaris TaxID=2072580 RepID=A0A9X6N9U5_HYPEX|nr:hypothetical protein BV898_15034 [Hypsibius exemplaris]
MEAEIVREDAVAEESDYAEEQSDEEVPVSTGGVRGKAKSGRINKTVNQRFSSLNKVKPLRTSWSTKMKVKGDRKHVLALQKEMKDDFKKEKEDARTRIAERKKREEANAKKSEIVQPIKNTGKIKRMKRKQLRQLEKR